MDSTKKILAIITQDSVFEKMEPIFTRASMEVTRATNGTRSLILATNVRYDLIVAEYPLPDLSIVDFLEILQSPTLANAHSPVVLLTKDEHAEDLATQECGVALFDQLVETCALPIREQLAGFRNYSLAHRDVIAQFGRFPHRNRILGRNSSVEELAHLEQHGGF